MSKGEKETVPVDVEKLINAMNQRGVKRTFVAKYFGIDISTLSRIISGKQPYISDELKLKIEQYIKGSDETTAEVV